MGAALPPAPVTCAEVSPGISHLLSGIPNSPTPSRDLLHRCQSHFRRTGGARRPITQMPMGGGGALSQEWLDGIGGSVVLPNPGQEGHTCAVDRAEWLLPAAHSELEESSQGQPPWSTVEDVFTVCFLGTSRLHRIRDPRQTRGRVTCATCSGSTV